VRHWKDPSPFTYRTESGTGERPQTDHEPPVPQPQKIATWTSIKWSGTPTTPIVQSLTPTMATMSRIVPSNATPHSASVQRSGGVGARSMRLIGRLRR